MGVLYEKGKGVPQDYKEAVKWYRLAAEQGYVKAQINLGTIYSEGAGVPQDYVLALMWLNIAGSNENEVDVKQRTILEKQMTPKEIEKAQEMARNWKPKK